MSRWLEQIVAQFIRERGYAGIWEIAAAAALWPYIMAPALSGWGRLDIVTAPVTASLSLAISALALAVLRSAIDQQQLLHIKAWPLARTSTSRNATRGLFARDPSPIPPSASGLSRRDALEAAIDAHVGPSFGALGIVRFANYGPMASFDPEAASCVITEFERRLKAAARRRSVGQISDDGFGIWFADASVEAAESELASIAYVMGQDISDANLTVAPDIHLGLAEFPGEAETARGLLNQALVSVVPAKRFAQVRAAKLAGAAAFEGDHSAQSFAFEQSLRRAVHRGELSLRYQPLVDAALGRLVGAEVLLRWRHPDFGDVSPSTFVPILEQTGLIHEIGLWTLNSACRQLSEWRRSGQPDIRLAINLSAIQLQNPALKDMISRVVASHGLEPSHVELELTETAAMEDQSRSVVLFDELRNMGFGIAIDDFGSGHSNLGYLKNLPITKLKIDREFVSHVDTRSGSRAICKALVELGAGLGISVLAEGVERYEEVATLRRLGCHQFQGYFFARPTDFAKKTCHRDGNP